MYGQQHPLMEKPGYSKVVWGLTFPQLIAILIGGKLSYEFSRIVPALPVKNAVIAHIHHLIPLAITLALLYAREQKTGLLLYQYIYHWLRFKLKQNRVFTWKRPI
jgi:hypothetical protein